MLSLFVINAFSALKVSDINIRMPFKLPGKEPPTYTITAFDSRATWRNEDKALVDLVENTRSINSSSVTVKVKYEGTRSEAATLVASVPNGDGRDEVMVTIFLDSIDSCVITTTARVLYLNSSVDLFTLTAFDKSGNTFTTIDSYDVDWIYNSTEIRRVPINETDLFAKELPQSKILVQGQVLGARPLSAVVNGVIKSPEIKLDVVEPIYLNPLERVMLPGARFTVKLCSKNGFLKRDCSKWCIKRIKVPKDGFLFSSDNVSVAEVENDGTIEAKAIGNTMIKVIDQIMPLNRAAMSLTVINPVSIHIPEQYIIQGQKPSFLEAKFYYKNNQPFEEVPENIDWEYSDIYEELGKHTIEAKAFGATARFNVYTCEPPKFENTHVTLVQGQNGYYPKIIGGSGFFSYTVTDENIFTYSKITGKIFAKSPGRAILKAHDEKLKVNIELIVDVEEMKNPHFVVPDREFLVGETINYSFVAKTASGKTFTFIEEPTIKSSETSVVRNENNTLIAVGPGFAEVTFKVTGHKETILIGVFQHLAIRTKVSFNVNENADLNKVNGPLKWPKGEKPVPSLVCGNAKARIIGDSTLTIKDKYKGKCTFSVQNKPTKENPHPRKDSIDFMVFAQKIIDLSVAIRDPLSKNNGESGLLESEVSDFDSLNVTEIHVPGTHPIIYDIIAFVNDEGFQSIGTFEDPSMKIVDQDGNAVANNTIITKPTTITLIPPPTIEVEPKTVTIIPVHNISTTESVSIYRFAEKGLEFDILEGTGNFVIKSGSHAEIDGTKLIVYAAEEIPEMSRTIVIADRYIPEFTFTVRVLTEEPAKLEIEGESYCIVNTNVEFTVHVYSVKGNEIQADSLNFTTETKNLVQTSPTKWVYSSKYVDQVNIIISTKGATGSRKLDVLDQLKFSPDNLTLFVNERYKPTILGGGIYKEIKFESSNESIANYNDNVLQALRPGYVKITATVPGHPKLGVGKLSVRILKINGVKIERFPDQPYVDSYIHLTAFLDTDDGLKSPRTISWYVDGCDNWEKQYDGSLILRADRIGNITVKCITHEHIESVVIPIDGRLKFATPQSLKLPIGSNYALKLVTKLSGVKYTIQNILGTRNDIFVNEEGLIDACTEGKYIVIASYKTQVAATLVSVTKPATIFLQSSGTTTIRPILLDNDGQEYDQAKNVNLEFNISNTAVKNGENYAFSIDEPTYISVNAHNEFFSVSNTTFLSNTLISPQAPVVIKGVDTEFICAAKRPVWTSANEAAVTITEEGKATAVRRGRATIYCNDEISTPVTVTEVQSIQLVEKDAGKDKMYRLFDIVPSFVGGKFEYKNVLYPKDLKIVCNWTAPDCGRAYAVTTNNETQKTLANAGCQIDLFQGRRCPSYATLNAYAISGQSEIFHDQVAINLGTNVWGIPSQINATVTEYDPVVLVQLQTKEEDVRIIDGSVGLRTQFTESGLEITADFNGFKGQGTIHLEYIGNDDHKGERMEINVFKGDANTISYRKEEPKSIVDRMIFNSSILLTCVFGFYAAYMLGQSGNLPPFSPYKGRTKRYN